LEIATRGRRLFGRGVRSGVTAVDRGGDVAPTARRSTIQPRRGPRWRPCEALSRAHRYVPRDPKKTSSLRANFPIAGTPDPFNPCCHPLNPYPPSSVGPPERLFARTHDAPRIEVLLSTISPRYRGGEPRVARVELGELIGVDVVHHALHEPRAHFVVRRVAREVALVREAVAVGAIPTQRDAIVLVHLVNELHGGEPLEHLHVLEYLLGRLVLAA